MEKVRIACGEWGSCFWEIDSSGTLDIGGGTGYSLVQAGDAPWYRYRETIKNIRFTGMADVPQGGRLSYMFCGCGNVAGIDLTGLVTGGAEVPFLQQPQGYQIRGYFLYRQSKEYEQDVLRMQGSGEA